MKRNGFTLIEVLIGLFVGLLIMAAIYGTMNMAQRTSANVDRKVVTQQDARAVLNLMAMEIRMASYNPNPTNAIQTRTMWIALSGKECLRGIPVATTDTIVVAMDLDGSGGIENPGSTNERITYSYNAATKSISRAVGAGAPAAILGGTAPFTNVVNPVGVPLFQYFDRANNNITASVVSPASQDSIVNGIPAIRRILITIVAETEAVDVNTKQPRTMVYSTSVIVRNHAIIACE